MTPKQFNDLWIIENLPDATAMRRKLLNNIISSRSANNDPVRRKAHALLALMDEFSAEQRELPLGFSSNQRDGQ